MPTHKKGQDKDKYYHLAKDQGYRSRAAFKLIQINKRFDFLSKARVCIDLCAAPGGWCQVAAKFMPPGSIILGIDLMPIKTIRNVKTIVSDITSAECRKIVKQELQGWKADIVLCDGAPNVGAAYAKDAYVQNELVLAALKTATEHLTQGGTFCTKVYRSVDYNSIIWVLQQLFENVQAMKPNSSRSQSSEIFVVCLNYNAPKYIDPKLLDPNHVFKEVNDPGLQTVDVLHKKYDKLNRRHRTGYDEKLGPLLTTTATVSDFVASKEAIRLVTDVNRLIFSEDCQKYKEHPLTTPEICECFNDLRLLGKIDFKKMLKWRTAMKKHFSDKSPDEGEDEEGASTTEAPDARNRNKLPQTEEEIQVEIIKLRENIQKKTDKEKKKARLLASKERTRQALGINNNAFGGENDMELFTLAEAEAADEVGDIEEIEFSDDENIFEKDNEFFIGKGQQAAKVAAIIADDNLEDELENAYNRYVKGKKAKKEESLSSKELLDQELNEEATLEGRTASSKRARRENQSNNKIDKRQDEDSLMRSILSGKATNEDDMEAYVKMLSAEVDGEDSDDDDMYEDHNDNEEGDSDDDEDDAEEEEDEEDVPPLKKTKKSLVSQEEIAPLSRAGKWFSNPIFQESMTDLNPSAVSNPKSSVVVKAPKPKVGRNDISAAAASVLEEMPKTDKELRKEKRKKDSLRQLKKLAKTNAGKEEVEISGFEVAPADDCDENGEALDPETKRHRVLISKGVGKGVHADENSTFEIVPAEGKGVLPIHDTRSYDSDHEEYDNHERAVSLAMGTMMLRTSKRKALVDASYNRYSWNDPKDLPSWFLDDEMRHNKPQLPVPSALLEQIKSKFQNTGTKDIKKVAEARMRKRKRAANQLKAAKKQANAVADNGDMSDKQKIKAIARAMKSNKGVDASKVYVVTKKSNGASMGTKGEGKGKLKFVDKRMKKDLRANRANAKKAKAKGKGKGKGKR